ncbi:MAG: hypothetical protein WAQ98_08455 [Blastocatellia bacterium]
MLKVKRFLLILPMLVCLFAIGNNQHEVNAANTINATNATNLTSKNINVEEPVNKDEIENNRLDFDIECEEIQTLFIPPIFGFCGISIGFGSDCGEDSNYSCVAAVQFCGGSLTMHTECALQ